MIGAKHMDPVMGIDIHIVMVPTPAGPVPTPLPHPFIGMVFDPMDLVPIVGATVIVNGMPVGVAGTGAKNIPPHFPIGGPTFGPPPPGNEGEIFMGSMTVLADGEPFSYTALPVLSCSAVGAPAPPRAKKGGAKSMSLPTSVVLSVPMGMPVLVGGPPIISFTAMAMKGAMAGLGKFRKMQKKAGGFWEKASKWLNKKADDILGETGKLRNAVRKGICFVTGHPVDIPTGKVFTDKVDFELPGPIPLKWERTWYSTSQHKGALGSGWHHEYDWAIIPHPIDEVLEVRLGDGRSVIMPELDLGNSYYHRQDKLTLSRDLEGYVIRTEDYHYYRFDESGSKEWPLVSISNTSGQQILLEYGAWGGLEKITDSCGRVLNIETDGLNRITAIQGPHPDREGETFTMMRYVYDEAGDLVQTFDALDHEASYAYENHLLVKETDRNGLSFYFEYDGIDHNAKCIHTWGDDGIYDHKLTYAGGITFVENSLGHTTTYHHNEALVTKEVDPKGNETHYEYNEHYETLVEVDALGRRTEYQYDEWGNRTGTLFADGSQTQMVYDEHKLIQATDPVGGNWMWHYDEAGRLIARQDCMGATHAYQYDERGVLTTIINPVGDITRFLFDETFNLLQVTSPDNATIRGKYDFLGRNRVQIDPKGNVLRQHFDLMDQVIQVDEPDKNRKYCTYDPEGNLTRIQDKQHDILLTYQGMGSLRTRTENNQTVTFEYDTEENLIGIRNEKNQYHGFELNENGEIEIESGFDGIKRLYQRDAVGRVHTLVRDSGIETKYQYDALDRVTRVSHLEGNREKSFESFSYRLDGELMEARNIHSHVKFERDLMGRILKEWEGQHWIESSYDRVGFRHQLSSLLGADLNFHRNNMGDIEKVSSTLPEGLWEARFKYDILGLETKRSFTGGISAQWERDQIGRPIEQQIFTAGGSTRAQKTRRYKWDVNERIQSLQIDTHKATLFGHDPTGSLAWAQYEDDTFEYRIPDEVGNFFRRQDQNDRVYGPSGQIIEADGKSYTYDAEGNLLSKTDNEGGVWLYEWEPQGHLARVKRPDDQWVSFTYDPFGRRLSKTFEGKTTHWIWDRNTPLHEWTTEEKQLVIADNGADDILFVEKREGDNLFLSLDLEEPATSESVDFQLPNAQIVTWVFEPGKAAPLAKLVDGVAFQIITDYLGTPIAMYGTSGQTIWAADTSIYGDLRNLEGERSAMPFRYPGQYEDEETGLYYNRFRYYDPEIGQYISQDPIGLKGGFRIYGYVFDPFRLVDIFGLAPVPGDLPDEPGIYVITNGKDSYVGSAGYGKQGMAGRLSNTRHKKARDLLDKPGTKVQYVRVDFGDSGNLSKSDKNNILRHYENREYEKQKKRGFNMTNDAGIQDAKKKAKTEKLIQDSGASARKRRYTCKK
ncbi:MAG: RHS repeat-associated core domain-containing protein [Bacteroidota bacterium]